MKFTLIELLIIIAIIGILTSILMPSLSKTRRVGQKAVCVNNLKQLQYAYTLYTDVNNGELARNYNGGIIGQGSSVEKIKEYSLIYRYLDAHRVYKCPGDPVPASVQARHANKSYGFNAYLNDGKNYSITKLSQISTNHNNVMGFVDEAGNVTNGFVKPRSDWVGGWHDESYNVSFIDGHVQNVKLQMSVSWAVVQQMIDTGNRDFSLIG